MYTDWFFFLFCLKIRICIYLITSNDNRLIVRKKSYRLVGKKPTNAPQGFSLLASLLCYLLHNRHSQQLGQLSTPPRAHSSRPIFFRLLTVTLAPSFFFFLALSIFFSLVISPRDLSMIPTYLLDMSLSTACSARSFPRRVFFYFSPSLSVTFNSNPPHSSLHVPIPSASLFPSQHRFFSHSIHYPFLFAFFSYLFSPVSFLTVVIISITLSSFFPFYLNSFVLCSVLYCSDFIYISFYFLIWQSWKATCFYSILVTRGWDTWLYDDTYNRHGKLRIFHVKV